MSLLSEIIENATTPNFSVSDLLRKCLVLGYDLQNDAFLAWIGGELNGYREDDLLPEYRKIKVNAYGLFQNLAWRMNDVHISSDMLPEPMKHIVTDPIQFRNSISSLQDLANQQDGQIKISWHMGVVAYVDSHMSPPLNCLRAWYLIPKHVIEQLLDTVKTKILQFALEIKKEMPTPGALVERIHMPDQSKQEKIFNTTIQGGTNFLNQNSSNVNQTISVSVQPGNIDSLLKYLKDVGLPAEHISSLNSSILKDSPEVSDPKMGQNVSTWLNYIREQFNKGLVSASTSISADLILKAILLFYGIST